MGYANLAQCVKDLEKHGMLRRIDAPLDPVLEIAAVQRRAFRNGGPALLFTRPKGCDFPMLANLFGSRARLEFIFRDSLKTVEILIKAGADLSQLLRHPAKTISLLPALNHLRPKFVKNIPVLSRSCDLADLPRFISWPNDGGPFITLPLIYSQDPDNPHSGNLGMYRVQLSGSSYGKDEVGIHYQIQRGIGVHHARALEREERLPVNIQVGGPPALSVAAVMPLPEGVGELLFAGLLGGRRMEIGKAPDWPLPVLAQCDFLLMGELIPTLRKEGPFGDHLGYYSLAHDFPAAAIKAVRHRPDAIWPFTSVGRPPQEDTVFGDFIHELTAPLISRVFEGVKEVHAVDAAGVHPLLLAIASERYTPYEARRKPRELLTAALHLLGTSQTALAKYLLICAHEDSPNLSCRNTREFFDHMLKIANFRSDLHFLTSYNADTLDYSGGTLHEGSKLIWASAGPDFRRLGANLSPLPDLPQEFGRPHLVAPGIVAVAGPRHNLPAGVQDPDIAGPLCSALERWPDRESFPLMLVTDDPDFCAATFENFLWIAFTRSDPATDSYGAFAKTSAKHWSCEAPFVLDCRSKSFHAPVLEEDPEIARRVEEMAANGGPLDGLF